jgi:PiT family inorganic phosphate transporter
MTWGVGANDLANIMSTTMGSKAISVRQAIIIAIIFEFAGAFLGSAGVSSTLRTGIINTYALADNPQLLLYGMLAVLLAGTTWMLTASFFGLPVSITNAIVGSIVGFGSVVLGVRDIYWQKVGMIAISWITSPAIAGTVAYFLFRSTQRLMFSSSQPNLNARRYLPAYLFLVGLVLSYMTVLKGLSCCTDIMLSTSAKLGIAVAMGLCVMLTGTWIIRRLTINPDVLLDDRFALVEKMFSVLMAFTACAMVFAHGSNDVAIAVGPMQAIISIALNGQLTDTQTLPGWIVLLGCAGVITGFLMYGRKVIATVGSGITTLTPSRAFAATLAAATTVVISTSTGIPVSATQTLVGAVLGVGLARGIGALNLQVIRNIFTSWIITLPAASTLAIAYFYLFKWLFS